MIFGHLLFFLDELRVVYISILWKLLIWERMRVVALLSNILDLGLFNNRLLTRHRRSLYICLRITYVGISDIFIWRDRFLPLIRKIYLVTNTAIPLLFNFRIIYSLTFIFGLVLKERILAIFPTFRSKKRKSVISILLYHFAVSIFELRWNYCRYCIGILGLFKCIVNQIIRRITSIININFYL